MSDDQDLHDKRISRLYRMGSGTEPPKHINEVIIRAAHAAISSRKQRFIRPSLATAAVLVLSISLVLKVLNQEPLEESVMESLPTTAPLTESEADVPVAEKSEERVAPPAALPDEGRSEATKPPQPTRMKSDEYRAIEPKREAPPAIKGDDTLGAAQIAPAASKKEGAKPQKKSYMRREPGRPLLRQKQKSMAPAPSSILDRLDCTTIPLPDSDSIAEWYHLHKAAVEQGQAQTANCLQQAFFTRFGKPLPDHLDE